jgi:diacylglycerol O-acyltransferase / wax synthase
LPPEQLSPLDAAFLRLEDGNAHMHIALLGYFQPPRGAPRPTVEGLRASVEARLSHLPRFRQRLAWPPPGLGDPFWVDDPDFDIARHVVAPTGPDEAITKASFDELADALLSEPLARSRPLWEFAFVPRLEDGRAGLVCRVHHAMVDGVAGMEVVAALFSDSADARPESPPPWRAPPAPGQLELGMSALLRQAQVAGGLLSRGLASALSPATAVREVRDAVGRAAAAVGNDVLFPAPASFLNRPIGPARRLVRCPIPAAQLLEIKRGAGVTFNDACLAVACGGLRRLALTRGETPATLKVAIPVSMRGADPRGWGNRISFTSIELPLDVAAPGRRIGRIHEQTQRFKRAGRAAATDTAINALALLPGPLRTPLARLGASARAFNLTISNVPGPRTPLYLLGAELDEGYLLAPLTPDHALSIAFFPYRDRVFFAGYADPVALPEVDALPESLTAEVAELQPAVRASSSGATASHPRNRS